MKRQNMKNEYDHSRTVPKKNKIASTFHQRLPSSSSSPPSPSEQKPLPFTLSPRIAEFLLDEKGIFSLQDKVEQDINPFPACPEWTLRPIDLLFDDPTDPHGVAHFYSLFHNLLGLPPINCEDDDQVNRAILSPFEKLELWQVNGRFDIAYLIDGVYKFRIFIEKRVIYQPTKQFPKTKGDRSFPVLSDEDKMNLDSLCLFIRQKIQDIMTAYPKL